MSRPSCSSRPSARRAALLPLLLLLLVAFIGLLSTYCDAASAPSRASTSTHASSSPAARAAPAPARSLYAALSSLRFLNNGTTYARSQYGYQAREVLYGEVENVTAAQWWWGGADTAVPNTVPVLYEAPPNATAPACAPNTTFDNQNLQGNDLVTVVLPKWSVPACQQTCCATDGCVAFTLAVAPAPYLTCAAGQVCCYLKSALGAATPAANMTSGTVANPLSQRYSLHPASGMRSAVPLGGVSTGSVELRADGTFHEWTIANQSPAGAAKYGQVDDSVMALRVAPADGSAQATTVTVRTHPPAGLPGVAALRYQGAYPAARLDVLEPSLGVEASVYGYAALKPTDLNRSATPSFTLSANVHNPTAAAQVVSFMWTLPFAVERDYSRLNGSSYAVNDSDSAVDCMALCQHDDRCQSWTFDARAGQCSLAAVVPLNYYQAGHSSGVKGVWQWQQGSAQGATTTTAALGAPLRHTRSGDADGPSHGDLSLWPVLSVDSPTNASVEYTLSLGVADALADLFYDLSDDGQLGLPAGAGQRAGAIGAVAVTAVVPAGANVTLSAVFSWHFPHRDHVYANIGNYYANLFADSLAVGRSVVGADGAGLSTVVEDILALHSVYYGTSLPDYLVDQLVNSFSHVRSAMYTRDGVWRQWEAFDCVDVDSIHNDYQRHIPYMLYYPDTEKNKLRQHAANQVRDGGANDGMLNEYLASGCVGGVSPWLGSFGGREMGDVTTLFIVEVWQVYAWQGDVAFVQEMYPHVVRGLGWQLRRSPDGLPQHLVSTYDLIGLDQYTYNTFNAVLHLLAMRATMQLATLMNDTATYKAASASLDAGSALLQKLLWNEDGRYYQAFWDAAVNGSQVVFSDSLYGQVVAWTLGLGDLLPRAQMADHLAAEQAHNDSPYGLLAQTGREPLSNNQDNSIWTGGSQDWTTAAIRLGLPLSEAYAQAEKGMENWRTRLHDLWNVWGLAGGVGLGNDGLHWCTAHYGFHMVLWHTPFAVSGQHYFAPTRTLTFAPTTPLPYSLPVLVPDALGRLDAVQLADGTTQYTLSIALGALTLDVLAVGDARAQPAPGLLTRGQSVSWVSAAKSGPSVREVGLVPVRGWNSYDAYGFSVNESVVVAHIDYIAAHLRDAAGINSVTIDYYWYLDLSNHSIYLDHYGRPQPDPTRFPSSADGSGFTKLAAYAHSRGLLFGIHTMRGMVQQAAFDRAPVWGWEARGVTADQLLLQSEPCPWDSGLGPPAMFFSVNTSHPAGQAFYDSLYAQYAAWGVDLIKNDCVYGNYVPAQIEAASAAIYNSGRDMLYSLSPGPGDASTEATVLPLVNMYRATADVWDEWAEVLQTFATAATLAPLIARPGGRYGLPSFPDLDMLPFGQLMTGWTAFTADEVQTMMTLWTIARSPLIYGGSLITNPDMFALSLLSNPEARLIHNASVNNAPLVAFTTGAAVWAALSQHYAADGAAYASVHNLADAAQNITVSVGQLLSKALAGAEGGSGGGAGLVQCMVRDVWARADVGSEPVWSITTALRPHASQLYRIDRCQQQRAKAADAPADQGQRAVSE